MVKLVFNPKKGNSSSVAVSRSSKNESIETLFSKLNVSFEPVVTEEIKIKKTEKNGLNDLIGLENTQFILNKWYTESLEDLKKSMLILIGPTGCGKTSLIEHYCNENNILLFSVKLTDSAKTKKELLKEIEVFIEYSSNSFFIKDSIKPRKLILIDEYQNGQNDLLSIVDITNLNEIRSTGKLCPILVISADPKGSKLSDLKKNNQVYYISDIPRESIKVWISKLYPTFSEKQIVDIIKKCKSDKRLLINSLNFIKNNKSADIDKYIDSFYTDLDVNIYSFTEKLFDSTEEISMDEIGNVYDTDGFLISWLVQENYLDYNDSLENIANSADSISYAETIFSDTYESNKNFLPGPHCLHGITIPRYHSKDFYKKNKCQLRTSCINNRYNIYLGNQKLFKKVRENSKYTLSVLDILFLKKYINQDLVKSKKNFDTSYLKNILNSFPENSISNLETIYKHFSDFKDPTGKEPKTKNFTLKFKEKLNGLLINGAINT
jgi:hypothetical protein